MAFYVVKKDAAQIVLDIGEFSGVKKAAGWLAGDIEKVSSVYPSVIEADEKTAKRILKEIAKENEKKTSDDETVCRIIAGTLGRGSLVDEAADKAGLSLKDICGKREVYGIGIKGNTMLIAGSDKRGTIYGLLKLSEMIGVTPMVYWGDTEPVKYRNIRIVSASEKVRESTKTTLTVKEDSICGVSKEPSVKYRGFFINDEWPAFGNWSESHFGDENRDCYEKVFEYLLRLKANYMWPAMWASVLWSDGPGLATAELADELGVVLGTSHHEPCIRAGEEFVRLNPLHKEYGTEWSFVTNREGVTKFWADSLKEREKFENIITVGMRGERDSKLFEDAKLIDNINVLKDVINCQKKLIKKYSPDKKQLPPMMLAIYKEVEEYYKGDAETAGLKEWDGLDGVTLMLCDDNFGNLRLMPDDDKRDHKGGYGMYYHFDYHGGPVSFEWINSSYLPKIWEQMTTCYDYGIREIWIVNVGDLKNQELPLSYFCDLAYDFDKYGTSNPGNYVQYLTDWINAQFRGLPGEKLAILRELAEGYTRLNNMVKPEVMNDEVYSLEQFSEADRVLSIVNVLSQKADMLYTELKDETGAYHKYYNAYVSLIYYQAAETFNLIRMWINAAKNRRCAEQGRVSANSYADTVKECLKRDKELVGLFHSFNEGKWYGMGLSRHIGFKNWNDEGSRNPKMTYVEPVSGAELIVSDVDSGRWSVGGPWCRKPLRLTGFDYKCFGGFEISRAGTSPIEFELEAPEGVVFLADGEQVSRLMSDEAGYESFCRGAKNCDGREKLKWQKHVKGTADSDVRIYVSLKPAALKKFRNGAEFAFKVKTNAGEVDILISDRLKPDDFERRETVIAADEYKALYDTEEGSFRLIPEFGKLLPGEKGSALKAYPQDICFKNGPVAEYQVEVENEGRHKLLLQVAPSNPAYSGSCVSALVSVNDGEFVKIDTVPGNFAGGENSCREWCIGVLLNMRTAVVEVNLNKGVNSIRLRALEPGFVLEKIYVV